MDTAVLARKQENLLYVKWHLSENLIASYISKFVKHYYLLTVQQTVLFKIIYDFYEFMNYEFMNWGQVNRQRSLPCHNLWDLEKQKRCFEFIMQREGEKPQTRGTFMGHHKKTTQGVDHWTTLSGITNYFSFLWCKNIYALHKIPSY